MPAIPLRGRTGFIRWHYYTAAGVTDFVVRYDQDRRAWTLRGAVVAPDAFKLQQAPLEFMAPVEKGGPPLRWPIVTFQIVDNRLTAQLGPPWDSRLCIDRDSSHQTQTC